jgi:hypothetical protein
MWGTRRRALMSLVAASAVVAPAAVLLPAWSTGATSAQALCVHVVIDIGSTPMGSNCPPGEPGPVLPPIKLPSVITPDGQLNLPPFIVPNNPKPPLPIPPLPIELPEL